MRMFKQSYGSEKNIILQYNKSSTVQLSNDC